MWAPILGRPVAARSERFSTPALAGVTLHFAVQIVAVRDATEDEVAHGHPHGPGGHHH